MKRSTIKTEKQLIALKAKDKEYYMALTHYPRLFVRVTPNGVKTWIYRYTWHGKQQKLSFGTYPKINMTLALEKWQQTNALLAQDINPKHHRQQQKQQLIISQQLGFACIAQQWLSTQNNKPTTLQSKRARMALLCDYFKEMPINQITAPQALSVLLDIQENSRQVNGKSSDKAKRCAGYLAQIFDYAIGRGYCTDNPINAIKSQLESVNYYERPAIIKPVLFGKLLSDIEALHHIELSTKNNLRLLALLFVRNGDIRRMRWQDIDFEEKCWYLKPTKGDGKEKMVKEMLVPLSPQVIQVLRSQQQLTGQFDYVFYSHKAKKQHVISENTANKVLHSLGYQGIHCAHGYRASAKTLLVQYLGFGEAVAEMALGHVVKAPNGRAYSRYDFLEDRVQMMNVWADYLDALRDGQDTTHFKSLYQQQPKDILQALMKTFGKDKLQQLIDNDLSGL